MELTNAQQVAINHIDGHLQIIACAGSGKTEVISRRIANILQKKPDVQPENIVAFTFTEKAAATLKSRIETALGEPVPDMYIGTIHGFCKKLLSEYAESFADFKVLDEVKNHLFITRRTDECGMSALDLKPCILNNGLYLQCIDKLIDDYDHRKSWTEEQRNVLEQYISCLYKRKYIDFSLLLFEALRQMQENPSVQDHLRTITHLVVDEYQDVNDLQEKLIRGIADFGANVCVVGDDDQTIYQFRGSNADNMISFPKRYPGVKQIRLEENFRCQKEIVDVAANVIAHNERRIKKQMISGANKKNSVICAKGYPNMDAEFTAIVEEIARLHQRGVKYSDIAVLVRKGKFVPMIAAVLANTNIPYTADSAEEFFGGRYFVRFAETLQALKTLDKAALYEQWKGIIDDAAFSAGFKYLRSCARGGVWRLSEILRTFCDKIDFLNENAADIIMRREDLDGVYKILDDYDEIYGDQQLTARIDGLLRFLGQQARQEYKYHNFREDASDEDAVQLMTIHKSKGLEFHSVFLPRLNHLEFPVSNMGGRKYYHVLGGVFAENKSKYESDIEDERKLFYVAITRAKQNLFMSYTLEKHPVSAFVCDAAESDRLQINREDLQYLANRRLSREEQQRLREEERFEQEMLRQMVEHAKEELYDYYATGNHVCPGIIMEYKDICRRGPEAILKAARQFGMI